MPNGSLASIEGPWEVGGAPGEVGRAPGEVGGAPGEVGGAPGESEGPLGRSEGPLEGRRAPGEVVLVPKCASQGFVSVGRYGCFDWSVRLHCAPPGVVISIQVQSM